MTWTTPSTWTTSQVVTAADLNTDIRDNMNETSAATASAAGDLVYADAANSMGSRLAHPGQGLLLVSAASNALAWRQPTQSNNYTFGATSDTTTSTTYTRVFSADQLPAFSITTGTTALVVVSAFRANNSTAGKVVGITYSVSGATTIAAADQRGSMGTSSGASEWFPLGRTFLETGLTAGTNVFQMEGKVDAGTGTVVRPSLLVIPLS